MVSTHNHKSIKFITYTRSSSQFEFWNASHDVQGEIRSPLHQMHEQPQGFGVHVELFLRRLQHLHKVVYVTHFFLSMQQL